MGATTERPAAKAGRLPSITPAAYSPELVAPIADAYLRHTPWEGGVLLDPFGGTGHRLAQIAGLLSMDPVAIEIEPGYVTSGQAHACVRTGDSRQLPFADGSCDGAVTSPAYPNGVSDNFRSTETSVRHTYIHRLRMHLGDDYELQGGNSAGMSPRRSPAALKAFYAIHEAVWREVHRVLRPGAVFVVNTKDPVKVPFRADTEAQLVAAGFDVVEVRQVPVRGLNHGRNAEKKYSFEDLTIVRKRWS